MNTHPQLIIKRIDPAQPRFTEGNDLKTLFFQLRDTGKGYRLHLPNGDKIHTDPHHVQIGVPFTFQLSDDGPVWTLTLEPDSEGLKATGTWSVSGKGQGGTRHGEGGGDVESGTFQAQAGTPVEVGATASA